MSNHYLLEIGTEELPPGFMETVPGELSDKVQAALTDAGLDVSQINVHTTPRRIALELTGVASEQASREVQHKGPPVRIAFGEDGKPTKAAEAFAQKLGVPVSDLKRETLGKEEYLTFNEHVEGRPTSAVFAETIPDIVLGLSGPRFMRWGEGEDIRFARPIRWLVSVWNEEHLPLTIGDLTSSNTSHGHRFLCTDPVPIQAAADYETVMEDTGKVIVDRRKRIALIQEALKVEAGKLGGVDPSQSDAHADLFEMVAKIVEYPWVLSGSFEEKFLKLPKEVTVTVMAAHQKYFPVETQTGELLPHFLVVSNARQEAADTIRKGNERVLKARLEDAQFFFDEDRKTKLADRLEELKGITFQRGLGSMFDKTQRLLTLTAEVSKALGHDKATTEKAKTAAQLSKTDLVTSMVFELTELQGVMGRIYAQHEGMDDAICQAIEDQYTYQASGLAHWADKPVSTALSLADKLDTMIAVFSQEKAKMPTGSKDPLGLRRMANIIISLIIENQLSVNLNELVTQAYSGIQIQDQAPLETVTQRFNEFMMQRLKGILLDKGYRYDMIDAIGDTGQTFDDLNRAMERLDTIKTLTQDDGRFQKIYEPANRISRILGKHYNPNASLGDVQPDHLSEKAEKDLYEAINKADIASIDLSAESTSLIDALEALTPPITAFFDDVLVNDENETVRQNRYNLLSVLNSSYLKIGNFSKLVIAGDDETTGDNKA